MTIASTIVGRIPQEKWISPYSQQNNSKWSTRVQSQKRQNDLCSFPKQPFNITVIQAYAPVTKEEEAEVEQFYEDLQDLPELIPKKDVLFIIRNWNGKVGSQEIPGLTGEFRLGVQNEAGKE